MPVYEEPRHRQVFKSGTTRHPRADRAAGRHLALPLARRPDRLHQPQLRRASHAGTGQGLVAAGRPRRRARRARRRRCGLAARGPAAPAPAVRVTSTTGYAQTPVTHRITNTGTGTVHALVVVNQTKGTDATTPKDAGFEGTPELTNSWFRVLSLRAAAGPVRHAHAQDAGVSRADQRRHGGRPGGPPLGAQRAGRLGLLRRRHRARDPQHQHRHRGVRRD